MNPSESELILLKFFYLCKLTVINLSYFVKYARTIDISFPNYQQIRYKVNLVIKDYTENDIFKEHDAVKKLYEKSFSLKELGIIIKVYQGLFDHE